MISQTLLFHKALTVLPPGTVFCQNGLRRYPGRQEYFTKRPFSTYPLNLKRKQRPKCGAGIRSPIRSASSSFEQPLERTFQRLAAALPPCDPPAGLLEAACVAFLMPLGGPLPGNDHGGDAPTQGLRERRASGPADQDVAQRVEGVHVPLPPHETDVWREVGPRRIPQEQEDDVIALPLEERGRGKRPFHEIPAPEGAARDPDDPPPFGELQHIFSGLADRLHRAGKRGLEAAGGFVV